MKIVYCGSSAFGIPCLEHLHESEHEICHIITQPAQPAGRGRELRPTSVAQWAMAKGYPCGEAKDVNGELIIELMRELEPDLFVVVAFGQKISPEFINVAKYEAINVHASLLPKYRGAAPINWAIINGEKTTGVTIITLADKMDAGFMLGKAAVEITEEDNAQSLHDKLALASPELLLETMSKIELGRAIYREQDPLEVTFAPKLKKSDGFIDWNCPSKRIVDKIRGLWPWPGVKTEYIIGKSGRCVQLTIAEAQAVEKAIDAPPAVGKFDSNMNVVCGEGALKILRLKPANSSLMNFSDFANGRCTGADDLFLTIEPADG